MLFADEAAQLANQALSHMPWEAQLLINGGGMALVGLFVKWMLRSHEKTHSNTLTAFATEREGARKSEHMRHEQLIATINGQTQSLNGALAQLREGLQSFCRHEQQAHSVQPPVRRNE